jgi:hypothetical protein
MRSVSRPSGGGGRTRTVFANMTLRFAIGNGVVGGTRIVKPSPELRPTAA